MSSELITKSKSAVVSLFSGQISRFAIQISGIVIMARLLDPTDYGLTAVVVALVALGEVVRDFGLSSAAIQAETLSDSEKSNLFWLNSLIGLILTAGLFASAELLAVIYHDSRIVDITRVMSFIFLINGLSTQFKAGISRDLKFKALAISETLAAFISTGLGIFLAVAGYGYWAIVYQQFALALLMLAFYIYAHRWFPSLPDFKTNMGKFTHFGMHLMASQILGQLSRSIDTLVIGSRFNAELLGIYNRAQQIVFMAVNQINVPATTLAVPLLSKLKNDEGEYYRFLNFGQSVMLHAVCLFFALLAINAEIVINLVLGAKWTSAVSIVQILSIGAMFQAANYSSYWIFVSKGMTKEQLKFTLVSRPFVILMIIAGSLWTIETVAIGYVAGLLFLWLYCLYFLKKRNIDVKKLLNNSMIVCCTYIVGTLSILALLHFLDLNFFIEVLFSNFAFLMILGFAYVSSVVFKDTAQCVMKLKLKKFKE